MRQRIFSKAFLLETANKPWFYPIVLLCVGLVAYGVMLPGLGFYWDDWESVFLYHLHNPSISFNFFYYAERPVSALAYLAFFPFLKMTPVDWQILALFLRWGAILLLYFTLNAVWPERTAQNRWIGVLLFVFPGYLLQPVSTAFIPHLTTFLMFSGSLFMTVLALKNRKLFWLWMPLSVLIGITQIFMMEYFVGLEIIRPMLIWFTLRASQLEGKKRILLRTLLYWLPFVIGLCIYAWWRFVYLPSTLLSDPNAPLLLKEIFRSPLEGLSALASTVYQDAGFLLGASWTRAFSLEAVNLLAKATWLAWFLGIAVAVLTTLYLTITPLRGKQSTDKAVIKIFSLGCVAILAGAAPVWAKGSQISVGKWSDRFALAAMFGAVVLLVAGIDWLVRTQNQKRFILAVLLASSVALQIDNGNKFRLDWDLQRALYWQLSWRIPALKPGTAVIGSGTFSDKSSPYDGVYIINLLFDPTPTPNLLYTYTDVGHFLADNYHLGVPILTAARGGQFSGSTSQAIGIYFKTSGTCVTVLDNIYAGDPYFGDAITQLIAISNTDLISTTAPQMTPDPAIFGNEPSHDWCYYFEKADLARQLQNWQTVLQLGVDAKAKSLSPGVGAEYLPFIEANAQTGQWSEAFNLSLSAAKVNPDKDLKPALCSDWGQFSSLPPSADRDTYLAKARSEFCLPAKP